MSLGGQNHEILDIIEKHASFKVIEPIIKSLLYDFRPGFRKAALNVIDHCIACPPSDIEFLALLILLLSAFSRFSNQDFLIRIEKIISLYPCRKMIAYLHEQLYKHNVHKIFLLTLGKTLSIWQAADFFTYLENWLDTSTASSRLVAV